MSISCKTCFAFDALAAIEARCHLRNDIPYIKEHIEKNFDGMPIIVSSNVYYNFLLENYQFNEVEKMDLKTLTEVFPNCIKSNDFIELPFVKEQFIKGFEILKNMDFTPFWEENCLPVLNKQCNEYNSILKEKNVDNILTDIQYLKPNAKLEDITVYITYFNYGVSFQLSPTTYLTNFAVNDKIDSAPVLTLFAHELIHGISNEKSRKIYKKAYQTDELLKKTHHMLIVRHSSPGDEEEFVVAVEHYISFKNGVTTKKEAYKRIFDHYDSSMPVAVIIFDELMKLGKIPEDINLWIYGLFENGTIKVGEVESKVNSILPGYVNRFMKIWLKEKNK